MTQEEKELLFKDLCARLPYGIIIYRIEDSSVHRFQYSDITENLDQFSHFLEYSGIDDIKPYLRPMSSMTEEEKEDYNSKFEGRDFSWEVYYGSTDWLNAHYFDYRGLIEKGLALKAPEDMYISC